MNTAQDNLIAQAIRFAETYCDDMYFDSAIKPLIDSVNAYYSTRYTPFPTMPLAVKRAIVLKYLNDLEVASFVLANLKSNGDYYFYTRDGIFYGVETDGYIHT